jgi:16S rRNA (cytidine1402-2'-O)-methyltransferase
MARYLRLAIACPSYHPRTMAGTLILCATPIGNLGDTTHRLAETLAGADVVYVEDTRRTAQLLRHLGVSAKMKSYFAGNERARNDELATLLVSGMTVALVSDAGMPVVSDPGASAVQVAIDVGASVTAVPGASAPVTALAISGFSGDRFVFEGFLPRKGSERVMRLASIAGDERTTVMFSATRRVDADLADLASHVAPDRKIVVTREMTKLHEEVWRGTVSEAAIHFAQDDARGEFTLVIKGATRVVPSLETAKETALGMIAKGDSLSHAVKESAMHHGVSRRELYAEVLSETEQSASTDPDTKK